MNRILSVLLSFILLLGFCACGSTSNNRSCNHDYYLSNYVNSTSSLAGFKEYTCNKCGYSYKEIIPIASSDSDQSIAPASSPVGSNGGFGKDSKTINLFDLPIYSQANSHLPIVSFVSDETDLSGDRHTNCYTLSTGREHSKYLKYDLGSNYSTLSGEIYVRSMYGSHTGSIWLEFYNGDSFLYSTAKLTNSNPSAEFSFDISGVDFLTVYSIYDGPSSGEGAAILADQVFISK